MGIGTDLRDRVGTAAEIEKPLFLVVLSVTSRALPGIRRWKSESDVVPPFRSLKSSGERHTYRQVTAPQSVPAPVRCSQCSVGRRVRNASRRAWQGCRGH